MIDDHALPAHDPETSSEEIIDTRSEGEASGDDARGGDGGDHARQTPAAASPMGRTLPEPNPQDLESRTAPSPTRESNQNNWQSPLTRSPASQHPEKPRKSAIVGPDSCAWVTDVGHNGDPNGPPTSSNHLENRSQRWVTNVGHKRCARGLSLRGSIYQFRVRVPADVRSAVRYRASFTDNRTCLGSTG